MGASAYCHLEIVKLLLDGGADPSIKNDRGLTAMDFAERANCKDSLVDLENNIQKKVDTKFEVEQHKDFKTQFLIESSKRLKEVFAQDSKKLEEFHGSIYADITERAIEKFGQTVTATRNIASASVGAYLDFQDNLYNQFLQLAESEIGKEAGRRATDVLWDMVDTVQIAVTEPESVRSFVKGFTTCEGGCIIIGGTIGAVGGTATTPGVGTVGGGLAGGFSGATVCLPGYFCVGLTNAGLKAIDIKNKNVYFREGTEFGGKAPGKPIELDGYKPPKNWDGKKVKSPRGVEYGWPDDKGRVWVPTGSGGKAHGGPHWDVQKPGGGYDNVYPGGKVRPGKK